MTELDERVCSLLAGGDTGAAATVVLRALGPEVLGFLSGALGDHAEADEVFAALSVHLWRSLRGFEGRCSIRTWTYVLARHELTRYRRGMRRHVRGRVPISGLQETLAVVRTTNRSALATEKERRLAALRADLSEEDRTLLILRVDRDLAWDEIALAFADDPQTLGDEDRKREAARLRKRFQILKQRLIARVRGQDRVAV
jgi:RNA polymerase sigma-70 factor (ECF subfamily)